MHYVKGFNINGVFTKQVACIELKGKPNAATEGHVGVLGIDVTSPMHDVYKCVAVNGAIYTWELLSSGLSIMSATVTGDGETSAQFPFENLLTPDTYVVKVGDLILDSEGYLYRVTSLQSTYCIATYTGTQVVAYGKSAYDLAVKNGFEGSETEWLESLKGENGADGLSIKTTEINENGELVITFTDDTTLNVGVVKGADGANGENGVSPTISITEIEGGHRVTVTDANGEQAFDVMDGEKGADGTSGTGSSLPAVTTDDNGKFLRVVDGVWSAVSVDSAEGVSF